MCINIDNNKIKHQAGTLDYDHVDYSAYLTTAEMKT